MKLHENSPSRLSGDLPAPSRQSQIEIRRLVSAAVAQHRHPSQTDNPSYTPSAGLRAHVLPLDRQGQMGPACQIEVKDFDERGITFHHPQPLHDRRALVVLEGLNLGRIAAEVDLSWCRFSHGGQYTSGGRFVQLVGRTA